jgi:2-iminobutanoate/2-iminopropanoate deaminase
MQIALDPDTGKLLGKTAPEQTRQCLMNVRAIVEAAGGQMGDVVKVLVYLTHIAAFGLVNEVYAEFFPSDPPARGVVEVSALPKGALVAVEAIAHIR